MVKSFRKFFEFSFFFFFAMDVTDLIKLPDLNFPNLAEVLASRWKGDEIYTHIGESVLVAINPYKELGDEYYSKETIQAFGDKKGSRPHVYKLAVSAFNALLRERRNQSIMVKF